MVLYTGTALYLIIITEDSIVAVLKYGDELLIRFTRNDILILRTEMLSALAADDFCQTGGNEIDF